MRCLVTGGSGFIGSYIVEELTREGNEVIVVGIDAEDAHVIDGARYVEADITDADQIGRAMAGVDEVYHVAGVLGTSELLKLNQKAIDVNVIGTVNCLRTAQEAGVKRFFYPTKPNNWLNTYSITKYTAEQFCQLFRTTTDMDVTILRLFNVYGPRQHLYPVRKAVPLFVAQALIGHPVTVYGSGEQDVDLVHARDTARTIISATRRGVTSLAGGQVLDLGSGVPTSVNDLAAMIIRLSDSRSEIERLPMRPGEPVDSSIRADAQTASAWLDIGRFVDLEQGMKETIEYYHSKPREELVKTVEFHLAAAV